MEIKYGIKISPEIIQEVLKRVINQVYKLLPMREEGLNWEKPLSTIIEELSGMDKMLIDQHKNFFIVLCKLEGLYFLVLDKDFPLYRRTIFECLGLLNTIKENVK